MADQMVTDGGKRVQEKRVETPGGTDFVRTVEKTERIPGGAENRLSSLERMRSLGMWIVGMASTIILFRFALKLFGANPDNGFAQFVYTISYPLVVPFLTLFRYNPEVGRSVIEFPDLVAIAAYSLGLMAILGLARILFAPNDPTGKTYS